MQRSRNGTGYRSIDHSNLFICTSKYSLVSFGHFGAVEEAGNTTLITLSSIALLQAGNEVKLSSQSKHLS